MNLFISSWVSHSCCSNLNLVYYEFLFSLQLSRYLPSITAFLLSTTKQQNDMSKMTVVSVGTGITLIGYKKVI